MDSGKGWRRVRGKEGGYQKQKERKKVKESKEIFPLFFFTAFVDGIRGEGSKVITLREEEGGKGGERGLV